MNENRVAALIETAIQREIDAYAFYTGILEQVSDEGAREAISFIANEEKKHQAFLEGFRDGKYGPDSLRMSDVTYYKIAEYQDEPGASSDMSSENVFLIAAHRELRSNQFYSELAAAQPEGGLREMLLKMANEELKHKEKMEYLYANTSFPQTSGG